MTTPIPQLRSALADPIRRFVTYKRALGRSYDTEVAALRLFDRFLVERSVVHLEEVTADLIEAFMASRPRSRPRSYNHLLCTVRRLFEWLVQQEELERSPVRIGPRRVTGQRRPFIFDRTAATRLLNLARELPDNPRAPMRGATYHALFAILYGLGLRVSEACRLQRGDLDLARRLLVIRKTKFYKSRLVPFGPRMATLLGAFADAGAPPSVEPKRGVTSVLLYGPRSNPSLYGKSDVPCARAPTRAGCSAWMFIPAPARLEALLRGRDAPALVPERRGSRGGAAPPRHVYGACGRQLHRGLLADH